MATSDPIDVQIDQDAALLKPEGYLRPGRSYNDFLNEYSGIVAQCEEDKELLTGAGFGWEIMPKYAAYLSKLPKAQADRIVAEGEKSEAEKEFDTRMPAAQKDKKLLMAMGRFVIAQTEDSGAKRVYDNVRAGHGYMDDLSDNVTMAHFGHKHFDIASKVRPGGQEIDKEYLDRVEKEALELVTLKGVSDNASDDMSKQVDRKNRLITLMVKAERDMKLYAEMAFYDNVDYYNKYYASESLRRKNRRADDMDDAPVSNEEQAAN